MADIKPESGALPPISVNIFARPINMIVASKRSADVLLQSLWSFRGPGGMIFQRHDQNLSLSVSTHGTLDNNTVRIPFSFLRDHSSPQ